MHVSQETPAQIHARLLKVVAAAEFRVLDGVFAFSEHPVETFPGARTRDALAFVRDEDVWSVLEPARGEEGEPIGVFSFHFPPGLDNSGFVGWLATHLKGVLGTGVIVVCGSNSARGGIFDYWGVPLAMREKAIEEIRRLRGAQVPSLDGVSMTVQSTAAIGVVGDGTRLDLVQRGARVLGRYQGGRIRRGCLVGRLTGACLTFRYLQVEQSGELHGGRSTCDVIRTHDGRIRIVEHFTWRTRAGSGTNIFEETSKTIV
jgi:hypothetical protein